jgi:hypothetical protein
MRGGVVSRLGQARASRQAWLGSGVAGRELTGPAAVLEQGTGQYSRQVQGCTPRRRGAVCNAHAAAAHAQRSARVTSLLACTPVQDLNFLRPYQLLQRLA